MINYSILSWINFYFNSGTECAWPRHAGTVKVKVKFSLSMSLRHIWGSIGVAPLILNFDISCRWALCSRQERWNWYILCSFFIQIINEVRKRFLGTFAEKRKATVSFAMSLCLSVRPAVHMGQLSCHWMDFHETWNLGIFKKPVKKIRV